MIALPFCGRSAGRVELADPQMGARDPKEPQAVDKADARRISGHAQLSQRLLQPPLRSSDCAETAKPGRLRPGFA